MGFNSVYSILLDLFPQVDTRVLRAVAIEHSKDEAAAVEAVLTDVMPFFNMKVESHTSPLQNRRSQNLSEEAADSAEKTLEALPYATGGNLRNGSKDLSRRGSSSSISENGSKDGPDQSRDDYAIRKGFSVQRYQESSAEEDIDVLNVSSGLIRRNGQLHADVGDTNLIEKDSSVQEEQSSLDGITLEKLHTDLQVAPSIAQSCIADESGSGLKLLAGLSKPTTVVYEPEPNIYTVNLSEKPEPNESLIVVSEKDISSYEMANESTVDDKLLSETPIVEVENQDKNGSSAETEDYLSTGEIDDLDDENPLNATVRTSSVQICSTEFLENIIENARSEKIALRSAKDSLISLIKEVEIKEKSADQAKEEASRSGLDTLARVHELKQMLQRAKEANDMHSGEVYGERAILATEARELQSRLLSLSDETAKALAILDEIRQALEVRLAVAEKEIEVAEKERLEKEGSAQKSLAHEESLMERVVQESKILKQEAEENSKLSEFLMDRGQSVDMLQGEISVLYQDIMSMKEKFDQRLPLSKSLSQSTSLLATSSLSSLSLSVQRLPLGKSLAMSQTSILATSSLSSTSLTSEQQFPELVHSPNNSKSVSTSSGDNQLSCGETELNHDKELVEDGWEVCDNREFDM